MWHFGTWLSGGLGSGGLMAALDDFKGLFQTKGFNNCYAHVPVQTMQDSNLCHLQLSC